VKKKRKQETEHPEKCGLSSAQTIRIFQEGPIKWKAKEGMKNEK